MENLTEKLKELGYDITGIIEGTKKQEVIENWKKCRLYEDVVLPEWSEEDIVKFSNWAYKIVTKNK